MKKFNDYHEVLIKHLKDPEEAAGYLNAHLENGDMDIFLMALRNVAEARGGLSKLSRHTKLNRSNMYKIFSKNGNPEVQTLNQLLDSFGLRLAVATKTREQRKKAA